MADRTASQPDESAETTSDYPEGDKLLVCWTVLNKDLGKHHNAFIEAFPNCLFVRVISCGPDCTLRAVAAGGVALIKEEVMATNAKRKKDSNGKPRILRDAPFLISEEDVIAFEQFSNLM